MRRCLDFPGGADKITGALTSEKEHRRMRVKEGDVLLALKMEETTRRGHSGSQKSELGFTELKLW